MSDRPGRVCPVEIAGSLDNRIRRWVQNPQKILGPYIEKGMTVLDLGCGPGFFSIEMAKLVGKSGGVIASDLQEGMLAKVRDKIQGTELEERITLHKCEENQIGLSASVDFVLLFYMVHEIQNQAVFFTQIEALLNKNGQVLMAEPPFHVSKSAFEKSVKTARAAGLVDVDGPKMILTRTKILKKS